MTLTGVGGVGKTRLAMEAARGLGADFDGGVWFVELAQVADGRQLVDVVASALALRIVAGHGERLATFADLVAPRRALLVLDNCEHLLDDVAEFVEALLTRPGEVRVLATSREALGVDGEAHRRVPSLSTEGVSSASMQLLLDRLDPASGVSVWDDDAVAAAMEICERLDGIPLAIELAAAQLDALGPRDVLDRLNDRFTLLAGGRTRRRQRQQTLQAVMQWSWDLLTVDEQQLLAELSVFSGGWTLAAAEKVAGAADPSVAALVRSLVAKSLIEPVGGRAWMRYRMLEAVRLFSQERLAATGLAAETRDRHAAWLLARGAQPSTATKLTEFDWLMSYREEVDNYVTAITWCLERHRWDDAAALLSDGSGLWMTDVLSTQVVGWVGELLDHDLDSSTRARVLIAGFYAAICSGQHVRADLWTGQAVAAVHDDVAARSVACSWSAAPLMVYDPTGAAALLDEAERSAQEDGSPALIGSVTGWRLVAQTCRPDGDPELVTPADIDRFGGRDTWSWQGMAQSASVAAALAGKLDLALSLCDAFSPLPIIPQHWRDGFRMICTALAGDTTAAQALAREFAPIATRQSNVMWHAEIVLMLGVIDVREGRSRRGATRRDAHRGGATRPDVHAVLLRDRPAVPAASPCRPCRRRRPPARPPPPNGAGDHRRLHHLSARTRTRLHDDATAPRITAASRTRHVPQNARHNDAVRRTPDQPATNARLALSEKNGDNAQQPRLLSPAW